MASVGVSQSAETVSFPSEVTEAEVDMMADSGVEEVEGSGRTGRTVMKK